MTATKTTTKKASTKKGTGTKAQIKKPRLVKNPDPNPVGIERFDNTPPPALEATTPEVAAPAAAKTAKKKPAAKEKKMSALDAAARVLKEKGIAMTCQELIGTMAAKGYWTSPGGKTPAATLYAAILREFTVKGDASRFVKTTPGHFAAQGAPAATTQTTTATTEPAVAKPAKKSRKKAKPAAETEATPADGTAVPENETFRL